MYPRLVINLEKIRQNVRAMRALTSKAGLEMGIVTKSFTADRKIVETVVDEGVDFLADARIANIKSYADLPVKKLLLRIVQDCEIEEVIKYADISLNSEIETIRRGIKRLKSRVRLIKWY